MDLREERFLFELPYDARLKNHFVNHVKDQRFAERESDWAAFDLQAWLGLDSPPAEGSMQSTTLMFSSAERRKDPMYFVERAWPRPFEFSRRAFPRPQRWLYSRPVRWLKSRLPGPHPTERRTVVQAIRIVARPVNVSEDWRFGQLRIAVDDLNRFLLATASVHGDPELSPIAIQDLPPIVFGMGWDLPRSAGEAAVDIRLWTYLVHDRVPDRPRNPLTREEADLAMWMTVESDHPMVPSSHLFLSASQAFHRGRFTHAIVDAGTAVEMLISAAIRLVGPERGYDDKKMEGVLAAPFASRVTDHFAKLLGFGVEPWNAEDALGEWWRQGYAARNEVVHGGHKPNEEEADLALVSGLNLQRDLVERMRADAVLRKRLPGVPTNVQKAARVARQAAGDLE